MRRVGMGLLILGLVGLPGCWERKVKRLSDAEFEHYYALRPFMTEEQRKTYLKLKTEEERNAYLKELGLWDRFYKYPEDVREEIVAGNVQVGWTKDMLEMAWGRPFDKGFLIGADTYRAERWVYRFETQPDGTILVWTPDSKTAHKSIRNFRREVIMHDDKIVEIIEKDGW